MEHLPYLRHKNGSGKIYELSEACDWSFIDRKSSLAGLSSVWESTVKDSVIIRSTVIGSTVEQSEIIKTLVSGSARITDSYIEAEAILNRAEIENSEITGKSRVGNDAVVKNCKFKNLTVKGSAQFLNWNNQTPVDGAFGYVSRGIWHRPPKIFKVSDKVTLTESVPGFVYVQCTEYPILKLLKIGNRLGRSQQWPKTQILTVRKICHYLMKH